MGRTICSCIEEPFNTSRNLGNTADDHSFRGLHLEMRRAFDLISEGKFEECCEQFVFPKEEERIFQKPTSVPRPILVRSSSQQHGGRGRGGYRGGRQFSRNNNNNRRASSSMAAYDANAAYAQAGIPQATSPSGFLMVPSSDTASAAAAAGAAGTYAERSGGPRTPAAFPALHPSAAA